MSKADNEGDIPMPTITITDESTLGKQRSWSLDILEETLSVRELIRRRIYQEVTEYNARLPEHFQGLVQPTDSERVLNGYRLKTPHKLDWNAQSEKALAVFERRGYIVLVDNQQIAALDDTVTLHINTEVTFIKLIPLIGG
jgi:hypothetical protein